MEQRTRGVARRMPAALLVIATLLAACEPATQEPVPTAAGASPTATANATPAPTGGGPSPSASGTPAEPSAAAEPRVTLAVVASGFTAPLGVATAGDGSGRLFVIEQGGLVKVVREGLVARTPFLDLARRISSGGERGLLGLAFHPRFPDDPRVFANYTDREGNTVVASYEVGGSGRADTIDPRTQQVLLRIDQPYPNHNGGHLAFGPDGYLYVGTGDGGAAGDPGGNARHLGRLLGKLLRIDVDRSEDDEPYGIPADNPFAAGGGRPEIWAYGLRNPWRFSFDPATGDLWLGDVGQGEREEVDLVRAGTPAPVDFGWDVTEGDLCYEPASGCDVDGMTLPVATYDHDEGCSITGGVVGRGDAAGTLAGRYVYGDFCSGRIWSLEAARAGSVDPTLLLESGRTIASFGTAEDGTILLVDLEGGELLRFTAD